jgi:transposase
MREWRCDGCGAMHDRDTAAAKVIGAVAEVVELEGGVISGLSNEP